ncbi:GNAT family N-acetyltransferase [Bacillus sp. FJAT-45350]|uniref:GNAT family N-acetyltransferase n=1 Tax=Bacillus sp. FJAT-45350 TaxID=2011014 RepID=UPI000BB9563C|nr:GNAT family N-acetyltransferase [Bacillus sp. FJAT-45350]
MFSTNVIEKQDKEEILKDKEELEFQLYRMQDNMKEIAKKHQVLGIDQTNDDKWVIVSVFDDGYSCKVMLNDCETAYRGSWDFSIQAVYSDDNTIHIGDIKGEENKGYGSICMNFLKDVAREQNIQYIKGDIAKRDWDHLDRLVHFYEKHNFDVSIDYSKQAGEIVCHP